MAVPTSKDSFALHKKTMNAKELFFLVPRTVEIPTVVTICNLPSLTLTGAIQIPTVSFSPKELNTTALAEFGEYIRKGQPQTVGKG